MTKLVTSRRSLICSAAVCLGGCAHIPNATVGYYLPKSSVNVKVVRTVACDKGNHPALVTATTPTVSHAADLQKFKTVGLAGLKGPLQDTDVKFDYYDDGRLRAINATGTGQGEAILKTIVSLLPIVFGFDGGTGTYPAECAFIKKHGDGKPLTVVYEGAIDLTSAESKPIPADPSSAYYDENLTKAIGIPCASVAPSNPQPLPPLSYSGSESAVALSVQQPGSIELRVSTGPDATSCGRSELWKGAIPIAQFGAPYTLPIPSPVVFGKQVFAASFAESGALTSVQYASNTGAGQALNVLGSLATAFKPESTADKAAELKAQADLIQQQQRLATCMADQSSCK